MAEPEEIDEDLFADLYEGDEPAKASEPPVSLQDRSVDVHGTPDVDPAPIGDNTMQDAPIDPSPFGEEGSTVKDEPYGDGDMGQEWHEDAMMSRRSSDEEMGSQGIGIKEDGKMFIGGLNWETTDQSLKDYFSQFGEVSECTVMRDAATGRSRGFGFLTFRDPKTVNIVMVKEHYLDGKIIDPKRAIPRDEQEKTSKIFVGGVSQDATEQDFKEYFMQYGRVIDATLMMDKDTGRPRGFGFVTFDSEAAVDATLQGDLRILGKPIEVKKAQPRGDMRAEEERGRGGRRGGREGRFGDDSVGSHHNQNPNQQGMANGMSPTMMVQYFQKMQQVMAMMQNMNNPAMAMGGMGGMNPAMMQQMKMAQMQQFQQQVQQQMQGNRQGDSQQGMQGMPPQMVQQMMQQMQGGDGQGNFGNQMGGVPTGPSGGGGGGGSGGANGGRRGTPNYNAQEQLAFEQQKYEQQQRRVQGMGGYQQGGPTSWEGMYDDVPQPNAGGTGGGGRGGGFGPRGGGHRQPPKGPANAPANAPTGPRNAGVPGANYRGGRGGGGHRGNYHPYRR